MSNYPEPHNHSKNKIKFELDFSNYETNSEVKKRQV